VKTPVCWNAMCFVHVRSDDQFDHYEIDQGGAERGRLKHRRANGMWLAVLRGAYGVTDPTKHGAFEGQNDVARAALNIALEALRKRVAADQRWLAAIDEEIGE
jgi:hypothetical protein